MKIKNTNRDINLILGNLQDTKVDLGWTESFEEFERQSLESIINLAENYETTRYIHKPYSGITTNIYILQSDIWHYFYFISGSTYVQNYEAIGLSNSANADATRATTNSFFRLEFYKTPNNEPPTRLNRRLVFAKNLTLPLGEKFYISGGTINNFVYVPVFVGSNYHNKENMYLFWFLDDTAFNETALTGTTFYMSARFFNSVDGSIVEFTNKDLSVNNNTLYASQRGIRNSPIKFYEKGISGAVDINEPEDMYYRVEMDRSDYTYQVYYDTDIIAPTPSPTPTPTKTITPTRTVTPSITATITVTPTITPSVTTGFIYPSPSITPSLTPTKTITITPTPSAKRFYLINIYASTNTAIVGFNSAINIGYNINSTGWTSTFTTISANPNSPSTIYTNILVEAGTTIYFGLQNSSSSNIIFGAKQSIGADPTGYCGRSSPYSITNINSNKNVYLNANVSAFNIQTC